MAAGRRQRSVPTACRSNSDDFKYGGHGRTSSSLGWSIPLFELGVDALDKPGGLDAKELRVQLLVALGDHHVTSRTESEVRRLDSLNTSSIVSPKLKGEPGRRTSALQGVRGQGVARADLGHQVEHPLGLFAAEDAGVDVVVDEPRAREEVVLRVLHA